MRLRPTGSRVVQLSTPWLPRRSSHAEAAVASQGHDERAPRAAGLLMACAEALRREQEGGKAGRSAGERERIFVFGGPKPKIFPLEASRRVVCRRLTAGVWREA